MSTMLFASYGKESGRRTEPSLSHESSCCPGLGSGGAPRQRSGSPRLAMGEAVLAMMGRATPCTRLGANVRRRQAGSW